MPKPDQPTTAVIADRLTTTRKVQTDSHANLRELRTALDTGRSNNQTDRHTTVDSPPGATVVHPSYLASAMAERVLNDFGAIQ